MVPSSSVFDTEAECSLRIRDLDFGERGSSLPLLWGFLAETVLGSGVTILIAVSGSESEKTIPCLSTVEDLLLDRLLTFFELVVSASVRLRSSPRL